MVNINSVWLSENRLTCDPSNTEANECKVFNLWYFRRILGNTWQDKVRNNDVLSRAGPCSHFHVNAVFAGYGELATTRARLSGRPRLRFKDICKRGMKACNIDTNAWETLADNRNL